LPLEVYGRVEIKNCVLSGTRPLTVEGGMASVSNSELRADGGSPSWAVSIWKNGSLTVQDTVISGGRDTGVLVEEGTFVARNSRITQNNIGVDVKSNSSATITSSDLRGNRLASRHAPSNAILPDNGVLIEEQVLK
jgi:hypothetical protein